MKINLPVTGVEKPFTQGTIVTKTDLKGVITYANEAFVKMSGFDVTELLGKSQNIVRHPDMPPDVFRELWETIKSGRNWRGIVKNRCKNGDHYWVSAYIVPVRNNGNIVGYMSVRSPASRQQIADADTLYRSLGKEGKIKKRFSERIHSTAGRETMALLFALNALIAMLAVAGDPSLHYMGLGISLLLSLLFMARMNKKNQRLQKVLGIFRAIGEGNLRNEIDTSRYDELGNIENGLAEMQVHMQVIIDDITQTVKLLDDRTCTLQTTLSEMLARFGRRASDVSAISAAIEEMSQSIIGVSNNAHYATSAAGEARNAAETGTQKMEISRKATSEAEKAMHEARETISELSTAVAQIGRMTETIREIADQTNLLALNAAIEAARAGETGRGFAVVADEVRKLAERTGQSTQEINNIVANVGSVTQASVDAINEVENRSQMSGEQLDATAEDLIRILDLSRTVNTMMSDIAQTNQEQSTVSGELAERMAKISNSLETSNTDIRAAEGLLEELRQESKDLNKMIEHFKT